MAADLFVVPTVTFRLLFVLVILAHERRRIVHVAVTDHPTAAWDGTTASQRLFRERGTPIFTARSRFDLCGRGDHYRGDEHPRGSHCPTLAVAERLR